MSSVLNSVTPRITNLNVVLKTSLNRYNGLNVAFLNIRSLLPKLDQINKLIENVKLDVFCFAETHLYDCIPNTSINIDSFKIYRNDRKNKKCGGICIYVRNYINCKEVYTYSSPNFQALFVELHLNDSRVLLGVFYKPPKLKFSDELENILSDLSIEYNDIILAGDFNSNYLSQSLETRKFISIVDNLSLKIVNTTEPTYVPPSKGQSSLLDIFITNTDKVVFFNQISVGITDHDMIFCSYNTELNRSLVDFTFRNYKAIDNARLFDECSRIDWTKLYTFTEINDIVECFNENITNLFESNVPLKKIKSKPLKCVPWFNNDIETAIALRDHALTIWKNSKQQSDRQEFKRLRNVVTKLIRNAKSEFFNKIVIDSSGKSTSFWNKVKRLGLTQDKENHSKIDPNEFCNFITANSSPKVKTLTTYINQHNSNNEFSFQNIDADIVTKALFSIKSNSVGLDGTNLKFIKLLYPMIQNQLVFIFNSIITKSSFPLLWKTAKIIPIPKCTNAIEPKDFRPISILPGLSKVFERIIKNQICNHLERNSHLNENQSAYRKNHSTNTALLNIVYDLMKSIDEGSFNIMVLFDFSKAFDNISHSVLIDKLQNLYGFHSSAIRLIISYLEERYLEVHANSIVSNRLSISSGVPQGSVLGPVLFLMYINDLPNVICHSKYHIFADDLQIYKCLKMNDYNDHVNLINQDIKSIVEWSEHNFLSLNVTKTKAIIIKNTMLDVVDLHDILVGTDKICYTNNVRNLGLYFDNSLAWSSHINYLSKRINFMLRSLFAITKTLDTKSRRKIFYAYLLPHFLYCDSIIFGVNQTQFNRIKLLFNRCVRYVFRLKKFDHVSKFTCDLIGCKLSELIKFRVCCQIFKVIKFRKPMYLYRKLVKLKSSRLNNLSIVKNKHKLLNESFFVRGITYWNSLPSSVKNSNGMANFKKNYGSHYNLSIFGTIRQTNTNTNNNTNSTN